MYSTYVVCSYNGVKTVLDQRIIVFLLLNKITQIIS